MQSKPVWRGSSSEFRALFASLFIVANVLKNILSSKYYDPNACAVNIANAVTYTTVLFVYIFDVHRTVGNHKVAVYVSYGRVTPTAEEVVYPFLEHLTQHWRLFSEYNLHVHPTSLCAETSQQRTDGK